jgi:hypothetical protein
MDIVEASWSVIKQDRELLALPVLSALASLATIVVFAIPVVVVVAGSETDAATGELSISPALYVLLFLGYVALAFVTTFFNAALAYGANVRLEGGDPTLGSALKGAVDRIGLIFTWALVSATVTIIIRQIQERSGILGRLFGFFAGTAWAVVTFLVLPIIVVEGLGPIDAVRRSGQIIRTTWGEGLAGRIGIGIIAAFVMIPTILLAVVSIFTEIMALIVISWAFAGVVLVVSSIVFSAMAVVFQTALYRYGAGLPLFSAFTEDNFAMAFSQKQGRRR